MVKGGNIRPKRNTRTRVRLDDEYKSDEDCKVNIDEEFDGSEDEYCFSQNEDESVESLGKFQEEWVKTMVNIAGRPTGQKGVLGRKKNGLLKLKRKKTEQKNGKRVLVKIEEDDVIEVSIGEEYDDFSYEKPRKKAKFSYREEKEDDDYNDSSFEEDEEFTLDELDGADDEEDLPSEKEVGRLSKQKKGTARVHERRRNANILKKTKRKKPKKNQGLGRKNTISSL